MAKEFEINGMTFEPDSFTDIRLYVGRLTSGSRINLRAHIKRGKEDGPTVLLVGGIHGDEINGIEIVRRMSAEEQMNEIVAGTVILIPILNVYGFVNFSRDLPDGRDVNRAFPGSMSGSLASRVARVLSKKILPYVDYGIDFHTGGSSRYNYPQVRYTRGNEASFELAKSFAAPFVIAKPTIPSSLRREALKQEIPLIVYEGGESLRRDPFSIEIGIQGTKRVLHKLGMTKDAPQEPHQLIHVTKTNWLRAGQAGLYESPYISGSHIGPKDYLGYITDPYGDMVSKVLSKRDAWIIGHNNAPVVLQGDALFHMGYEHEIILRNE